MVRIKHAVATNDPDTIKLGDNVYGKIKGKLQELEVKEITKKHFVGVATMLSNKGEPLKLLKERLQGVVRYQIL